MSVPKVAAINDLSGLGKCSLTAAIPILAAAGVQACPMPTAVLSNQTGFPSYAAVSLAEHLDAFAHQWELRGIQLDGIFSGFLMDAPQVLWVKEFILRFRREGTLVLVDPVLGDRGALYKPFSMGMVEAHQQLIRLADVVTPNLTEALLLLGKDPAALPTSLEAVEALARELCGLGPSTAIITGVEGDGRVWNVAYDRKTGSAFRVSNRKFAHSYSGTGDILASVVCGCMVRGESPKTALKRAAALLEASLAETAALPETDPNEGIAFEPHLGLLMTKEDAL